MTGKAAEIAAIVTELPLDTDFFQRIQDDLIGKGELSDKSLRWVASVLSAVPLRATQAELKTLLASHRERYVSRLMEFQGLNRDEAAGKKYLVAGPAAIRPFRSVLADQTMPLGLVLAALISDGKSTLLNSSLLDDRHGDLVRQCVSLGALVESN